MSLNTEVLLRVRATQQSDIDLATRVVRHALEFETTLADGAGAGKANKIWSDRRTLAGGANETLDLSALTDAFGGALAFTGIKLMKIIAGDANGDDLAIGGGMSEQFIAWVGDATDIVNVPPGMPFVIMNTSAAGFAVGNNASDKLKIENLGSVEATYEIILVGI